jgi:hypothetical protein
MPSVLDLLEAREKKMREDVARLRQEAERVQAALGEVERALQRPVDARGPVAEVLTEPTSPAAGPAPRPVAGSVVPYRIEGMAASVLALDCQRSGWRRLALSFSARVGDRRPGLE